MEIKDITLEQIVTFAIITENGEGIMGKAPSYLREKFQYCMQTAEPQYLEAILDSSNKAKLEAWRQRWTSRK
jgi:hypothetical protein